VVRDAELRPRQHLAILRQHAGVIDQPEAPREKRSEEELKQV
jgi:hypothetical protein